MPLQLSNPPVSRRTKFPPVPSLEASLDAVISEDLNGIIRSWNQGAERLFGYTAEEVLDQAILRLIPPDRRGEEESILQKLRTGDRTEQYETLRLRKDGEVVEVSVSIFALNNKEGRTVGAFTISRDISHLKRLERLLIQSEKLAASGRMAAVAAHEINNPLDSLLGLIFLARQSCDGNEDARRHLLTAERELNRLSRIACRTLGYCRQETEVREIRVEDLIEDVLAIYRPKLIAGGISVECEFEFREEIRAAEGDLIQVFSNVVLNAIDAMPDGGLLSFATQRAVGEAGNGVQILIRDDGTGIRPEHLEKIFELFFTTKGSLGTGIGLWVSRQMIARRGGQISVTSSTETEGHGTEFRVYLPFVVPGAF